MERKLFIPILMTFLAILVSGSYCLAIPHYGYIRDVGVEKKTETPMELVVVQQTEKVEDWNEIIFDPRLVREFDDKYKESFGRSEIIQTYNTYNHHEQYIYSTGDVVTIEDDASRRREFGEFMIKRLGEHHADQYARRNENLKVVYQAKERFSNVKVDVREGYQFKMRYSLSGNFMRFRVNNPYDIRFAYKIDMDSQSLGPSNVVERTWEIGYDFSPKLSIDTYLEEVDGIFSSVLSRRISSQLKTSLTTSTFFKPEGETERERLILIGASYVY